MNQWLIDQSNYLDVSLTDLLMGSQGYNKIQIQPH